MKTDWCKSIGEERDIGGIPPPQLDRLLSHFFMNACRQDGEPDTLTSIHRSIDRYLTKDLCKNYSIIQQLEFTSS